MSTLEEFIDSTEDGEFFIGHASALVRISNKLILFDPIWEERPYGNYWKFVPEQINCDSILDKIDACIVSHIHADHLSEAILSKLQCPIYIAEGRPELTARLLKIRLDIFTFPYFKWLHCLPDIQIYFVKHPFNSIDSSCFIRNGRYQIFHGNDCFLDTKTISRIKDDIDSKTNVAMVPFAFIHSYPFLLQNLTEEERTKEIHRLNRQTADQAYEFVDQFKPERIIPCGANLFYNDGADNILNSSIASPFMIDPFPPFAGSYYTLSKSKLVGPLSPTAWKQFLEDELTARQDPVVYDISLNFDLTKINDRLKKATPLQLDHEITINSSLIINAKTREAKPMHSLPKEPYHKFMVDGPILKEWLDGKLTFEQVIGTRRFVYYRYPNEYNQLAWEWILRFL